MTKRALCVGNNYPGTEAELNGCVNDAHDWAEVLAREGYEVTVLLEATKQDTLTALDDLVDSSGFADRIVFTYSGHGSWVPDTSGDEHDERDEVLVMSDYLQGGLLLDDELQDVFDNLKFGAGALILSDSCHSGTVSRIFGEPSVPVETKVRFLSPAAFTGLTEEEAIAREAPKGGNPRATASLISGCKDIEYSYDAWFDGRANGAFSRAALDTFRSGIGLNAWHRNLTDHMAPWPYQQHPQLTTASPYRRYAKAL